MAWAARRARARGGGARAARPGPGPAAATASFGLGLGRRAPAAAGAGGGRGAGRGGARSAGAEAEAEALTVDALERLQDENALLKLRVQQLEAQVAALQAGDDAAAAELKPAGAAAAPAEPAAAEPADFEALLAEMRWPSPEDERPFWERPPRAAAEGPPARAGPRDPHPLHVVHVTAEMAPLAKVGGLGDVITGLARSCAAKGHAVEVVLPYYECLPDDEIEGLAHVMDFEVPRGYFWDGEFVMGSLRTAAYSGRIGGCDVVLLRPDWDEANYFRGGGIYGGSYNETEAYLYFSRAALEFLKASGRQPQIIHVHEWQCSAVAMLYWEAYHQQGLDNSRVVLTIHNMDNTGECTAELFNMTGLDGNTFNTIERAMDERTIGHNPERMSLLKGGIVYSNGVTTVSPTYAEETRSGHGGWLGGTLTLHNEKYHGILNGIDVDIWDPRTDPFLPVPFSPATLREQGRGKRECKKFVRLGLGLADDEDAPIVVCVSRLVPQKGIHLIRHAIHRTVEKGGQFILLGSGHADGDFRHLAEHEYKDHPQVKLMVTYSDPLSHHLFAAADVVLVPSMFEPCGLTQMIGLRYGALPVVRRTGGLADTIKDVDDSAVPEEQKNGFVFDGADEGALNGALDRAIKYYKERPTWWHEMSAKVADLDFSWDRSSEDYVALYRSIADQ